LTGIVEVYKKFSSGLNCRVNSDLRFLFFFFSFFGWISKLKKKKKKRWGIAMGNLWGHVASVCPVRIVFIMEELQLLLTLGHCQLKLQPQCCCTVFSRSPLRKWTHRVFPSSSRFGFWFAKTPCVLDCGKASQLSLLEIHLRTNVKGINVIRFPP
jgi:hypothetical protein